MNECNLINAKIGKQKRHEKTAAELEPTIPMSHRVGYNMHAELMKEYRVNIIKTNIIMKKNPQIDYILISTYFMSEIICCQN